MSIIGEEQGGAVMGYKETGEKLYEDLYDVVRGISASNKRIREFRKKTAEAFYRKSKRNP